ncbi:uncharacterized protein VNE69_06088 [Vairimorpha necatrix]|uniref:Uncharacterized protein n=1 Tax=Vairimorpha necatrix TaxID=6039 RepID=A0AAX4JCY8_9MICR
MCLIQLFLLSFLAIPSLKDSSQEISYLPPTKYSLFLDKFTYNMSKLVSKVIYDILISKLNSSSLSFPVYWDIIKKIFGGNICSDNTLLYLLAYETVFILENIVVEDMEFVYLISDEFKKAMESSIKINVEDGVYLVWDYEIFSSKLKLKK